MKSTGRRFRLSPRPTEEYSRHSLYSFIFLIPMPELAKAYEPQQVEDRLYAKWQDGGWFRANPKSAKKPYSIVMPPPNVTGKLTLGHVLNNTIQDILARKARMEGKEVLWLPGTDHAGLATQTAVEKHLRANEKKTRHDFTREEFVQRV